MSIEILGAIGAAMLAGLAWLIRIVRRADRDKRDLEDAREYQATMERMTNANVAIDPADARRRMHERDPNKR